MYLYVITHHSKDLSVAAISVADKSKVILSSKVWTDAKGDLRVALLETISAIGQYLQVSKDPNIEVVSNDKWINTIIACGIPISDKSQDKDLRILYLELTKNVKPVIVDNADTTIIDNCVLRITDKSEGIYITDKVKEKK